MGFTEHLTVGGVGLATFTPGSYMVGIHFGEGPDFGAICVVTEGAERTVRHPFVLSRFGLFGVDNFFGRFVEHADIE